MSERMPILVIAPPPLGEELCAHLGAPPAVADPYAAMESLCAGPAGLWW